MPTTPGQCKWCNWMVFLNSVKGWKQIGTAAVITNGHVAIQTFFYNVFSVSDKCVVEEWEHCEQYSAHNENPARNDYTTYMCTVCRPSLVSRVCCSEWLFFFKMSAVTCQFETSKKICLAACSQLTLRSFWTWHVAKLSDSSYFSEGVATGPQGEEDLSTILTVC